VYISASILAFIIPHFITKLSLKASIYYGMAAGYPLWLMYLCPAYKYKYPKSTIFIFNDTFIYTVTIICSVLTGSGYISFLIGLGEYVT
jgi:hypothetical protein